MAVASAGLLGAVARALAAEAGFPRNPAWHFAFVSYLTTDPLFVALQYGMQDGVALVGCTASWAGSPNGDADEVAKAVDVALDQKVDGIALPLLGARAVAEAVERARAAGVPVVVLSASVRDDPQLPYIGLRAQTTAAAIAARLRSNVDQGDVGVLAGERELVALRPLADALVAALRRSGGLRATLVSTGSDVYAQLDAVGRYLGNAPGVRAVVALDTGSTEGLGLALTKLPPGRRAPFAVGWGVLPATLKLVDDGRLAFTIDEQPYQQGFLAALELFLTKRSRGLLGRTDVRVHPLFVTKAKVARYLDTRTRFEGSSSRQRYPIG
jgi:simple sugar transport system substrate-binding protein